VCDERNIHYLLLSRADLDLSDKEAMEKVINELNPWSLINAAGYVRVDDAEEEENRCLEANCYGPALLADICNRHNIKLLSFSSDLVFDGAKKEEYTESNLTAPLNVYGRSKAMAEEKILSCNPDALVIRTSSFFGPWDEHNFVFHTLADLKEGKIVTAANDVYISPTYVPDLANESLNLLLDGEAGIFHVTNDGALTWAGLGRQVALMAGYDPSLIKGVPLRKMRLKAQRPYYSPLKSERGILLPSVHNALERYFEATGYAYRSAKMAV
jgi:dTDP-4-dehydrorhamnose reductase